VALAGPEQIEVVHSWPSAAAGERSRLRCSGTIEDCAMTQDFIEAIADVLTRKAQRIAAPGKWRVWRDGERVVVEVAGL